MKKTYWFIFLLFTNVCLYSQDTLKMQSGKIIVSKVLEVNQNEVRYKNFSNLDGPEYVVNKSDVSSVHYQNGEEDVFPNISSTVVIFNNGVVQTFSTSNFISNTGQSSVFTTTINVPVNTRNNNVNYANNNNCNTVTGGDLIFGFLDLIFSLSDTHKSCTNRYNSPTWCSRCSCKHR